MADLAQIGPLSSNQRGIFFFFLAPLKSLEDHRLVALGSTLQREIKLELRKPLEKRSPGVEGGQVRTSGLTGDGRPPRAQVGSRPAPPRRPKEQQTLYRLLCVARL